MTKATGWERKSSREPACDAGSEGAKKAGCQIEPLPIRGSRSRNRAADGRSDAITIPAGSVSLDSR